MYVEYIATKFRNTSNRFAKSSEIAVVVVETCFAKGKVNRVSWNRVGWFTLTLCKGFISRMENGPFRVVLISIRKIVLLPPVASATMTFIVASIYIYIYIGSREENFFERERENLSLSKLADDFARLQQSRSDCFVKFEDIVCNGRLIYTVPL